MWGLFGGFLYTATLTLTENLTCAASCGLVWWLPLCHNPNIGRKFNLRGQLWGLFGGFLSAETLTLAENLTCAA